MTKHQVCRVYIKICRGFILNNCTSGLNLIAKWNGNHGDNKTWISYTRNGILMSSPDGTLKYFKRQEYVWNEIFQQTTTEAFVMLKGYHDKRSKIMTIP